MDPQILQTVFGVSQLCAKSKRRYAFFFSRVNFLLKYLFAYSGSLNLMEGKWQENVSWQRQKSRVALSAVCALCRLSPHVRPCVLAVTRVLCNRLVCCMMWVCLLNTEQINRYDKAGFQDLLINQENLWQSSDELKLWCYEGKIVSIQHTPVVSIVGNLVCRIPP